MIRESFKLVACGLLFALFGVGMLYLAGAALLNDYVIVGRRTPILITLANSPIQFYSIVAGMAVFGAGSVLGAFSFMRPKKENRAWLIKFANTSIFSVRPAVRRLAVVVGTLFALLLCLVWLRS